MFLFVTSLFLLVQEVWLMIRPFVKAFNTGVGIGRCLDVCMGISTGIAVGMGSGTSTSKAWAIGVGMGIGTGIGFHCTRLQTSRSSLSVI